MTTYNQVAKNLLTTDREQLEQLEVVRNYFNNIAFTGGTSYADAINATADYFETSIDYVRLTIVDRHNSWMPENQPCFRIKEFVDIQLTANSQRQTVQIVKIEAHRVLVETNDDERFWLNPCHLCKIES